MKYPRLMLITDRHRMHPSFEVALIAALRGGARLIQLREKDATPREVVNLAVKAQRLGEVYGAKCIVNARADIARAAHTDGVHLPEHDIIARDARATLGHHAICGVSVHSVEAARQAATDGADYIVFGPIFPTPTHPEATCVGVESLREVVASTSLPVFAIGGIDAENATACLEAGAHGVAVISAVWAADNVEAAVRALVEKLEPETLQSPHAHHA